MHFWHKSLRCGIREWFLVGITPDDNGFWPLLVIRVTTTSSISLNHDSLKHGVGHLSMGTVCLHLRHPCLLSASCDKHKLTRSTTTNECREAHSLSHLLHLNNPFLVLRTVTNCGVAAFFEAFFTLASLPLISLFCCCFSSTVLNWLFLGGMMQLLACALLLATCQPRGL